MTFLQAEWRKLAIINYQVDASLLAKYLPAGTELDDWNGINYLSLVGFMFKNTKVLGLKIPFHTNFEEVNLRFYVKRKSEQGWKRGVVFIKEIVPRHAISFVANKLYKEHYATRKMNHQWSSNEMSRTISYQWKAPSQVQKIQIVADKELIPIQENSETEFILEHYWGYTKLDQQQTTEYEVSHPKWNHYKVRDFQVDVDFGVSYGKEFQFLNLVQPKSVMLAEGSVINVKGKSKLE